MKVTLTYPDDATWLNIRVEQYGEIEPARLGELLTRVLRAELGTPPPSATEGGVCPTCDDQEGDGPDPGYYRKQRYTADELLDEWEFLRGEVNFRDFPARVGISRSAWEQAYHRAQRAGDPRAVRALADRRGRAS